MMVRLVGGPADGRVVRVSPGTTKVHFPDLNPKCDLTRGVAVDGDGLTVDPDGNRMLDSHVYIMSGSPGTFAYRGVE